MTSQSTLSRELAASSRDIGNRNRHRCPRCLEDPGNGWVERGYLCYRVTEKKKHIVKTQYPELCWESKEFKEERCRGMVEKVGARCKE